MRTSGAILRRRFPLLPLLSFLAVLALASEPPASKPTEVPATDIAHLPVPQSTGSQMLLQKEDGKQYLYVRGLQAGLRDCGCHQAREAELV
jgi:hypothetical protein